MKKEWVFEVCDDRNWISKNQIMKLKQWMKKQIQEYEQSQEQIDFEEFVEGKQNEILDRLYFANTDNAYCRLDWDILQHSNLERWYWQIRFFVSPQLEKEKQLRQHKKQLLDKLKQRMESQRQQQTISCKYRVRR